jgi:hypothetical protein
MFIYLQRCVTISRALSLGLFLHALFSARIEATPVIRFRGLEKRAPESIPALNAGAVPPLRSEPPRIVAASLPRQSRLDVDHGIEKLGPELNPVPLAHAPSGASGGNAGGPLIAGVEDTVARLESAPKAGAASGSGAQSSAAARRADEVRIIPDETKMREQFRAVSTFFDPPMVKSSPPSPPVTSSATYEQK